MKQFKLLTICFFILSVSGIAQFSIKRQVTIGGDNNDFTRAFIKTTDGGYIAGGYSNSNKSGEKSQNNSCRCDDEYNRPHDFWIVKLDAAMNIQWDKTTGGKDDEFLSTIINTQDGGYLVGGHSSSNISGEKTEARRGPKYTSDYWIVKLDAQGNILWDKTIGGKDQDYLNVALQTTDGGYLLGGESLSGISGEKSDSARGDDYDYWIVKIDESGNIQWDKTIGGVSADYLNSMVQSDDGGFLLAGTSRSNKSGDKRSATQGREDYWLVKINATGTIEWDKTFGGNKDDHLAELQKTNDGGYILGGSSNSKNSGDKTQKGRGYLDYWIMKLNSNAEIEWNKTIGGNGYDGLRSLRQTADGGYILAGNSSSDISGEKSENTRGINGMSDFWVVKLNKNGNIEWDKTLGGDGSELGGEILYGERNRYILAGSSYSNHSGDKSEDSRGIVDYWVVAFTNDQVNKITSPIAETDELKQGKPNNPNLLTAYPNPAKDILHLQSNNKTVFTLTNTSGVTVSAQTINGKGEMNVSRLQAGVYYLKNNATGAVQKIIIQ